jgi:hypothetical protein
LGPEKVLIVAHIPLDFVAKGSMCGTRKEAAALAPEHERDHHRFSLGKAASIAKTAEVCIIQAISRRTFESCSTSSRSPTK